MNSGLPSSQRGAPDRVVVVQRHHTPIRALQWVLALALAFLLTLTLGNPAAADDLTDQKRAIDSALAKSEEALEDFGDDLNQAASTLEKSRAALADARAELAAARSEMAVAKREDERQANELSAARYTLERARHEVAIGQVNIESQRRLAGTAVIENAQQGTDLQGIAMLVTDLGTADVATRVQLTTVVFESTQRELDRLSELQMQLQLSQDKLADAEAAVENQREQAAQRLTKTQELEARASTAEASVETLVSANASAVRDVETQLAAEQQRNRTLESEQASVERRIAERIAKAKEEARKAAEAKRIAEAKAAEARRIAKAKAAAAKAAAEKAAAQKTAANKAAAKKAADEAAAAKKAADKASGSTSSSSGSSSSGSLFSMPVNGYITSYYGMRFHPVLHYWKLHDGVDFGAGCGTPIRAPRSGVVTDRYYNAGYGNRLMIDHGLVSGSYITTGYNHASSYIVGVGQRVSRGQVIGYVGSTGYSTGCHLHLMVWEDGSVVNPLKWF